MENNNILLRAEEAFGVASSSELLKRKAAQLSLYSKLSNPIENFNFTEWMLEFSSFAETYDRFLYSAISSAILNENDENKITFVMENIKTVVERTRQDKQNMNDYPVSEEELSKNIVIISQAKYKMLLKLYDHCNLANTQRTVYNQTKQDISQMTDTSIKQKIGEYEKDITTQLISLVSIFTALSFVIFGGISVLDNLLQNIKTLLVIKTFLIATLWLICMSNVFILFTRLICFLIGKEMNFRWKTALLVFNLIFVMILAAILYIGYCLYGKPFF